MKKGCCGLLAFVLAVCLLLTGCVFGQSALRPDRYVDLLGESEQTVREKLHLGDDATAAGEDGAVLTGRFFHYMDYDYELALLFQDGALAAYEYRTEFDGSESGYLDARAHVVYLGGGFAYEYDNEGNPLDPALDTTYPTDREQYADGQVYISRWRREKDGDIVRTERFWREGEARFCLWVRVERLNQ